MEKIEQENPTLKGVLPHVYGRPNLASATLGELIDLIGDIARRNGRAGFPPARE